MRIVMSQPLEDCFAESLTQEIGLSSEITEDFIQYLGLYGELQYFPTFSRPFFRLDKTDCFTITGIQGNQTMRVILCHDNKSRSISCLDQMIRDYQDQT